jgi:hypothetical protein
MEATTKEAVSEFHLVSQYSVRPCGTRGSLLTTLKKPVGRTLSARGPSVNMSNRRLVTEKSVRQWQERCGKA